MSPNALPPPLGPAACGASDLLPAAGLPRDPRFARLHDLPGFHALVGDHLAALDQQRESYLAVTITMAEHRE